MFNGFAFEELTEQVERRTQKAQAVEDHRLHNLPGGDLILGVGRK